MSTTADAVRIAVVPEATMGTTPATPSFDVLRVTGEDVAFEAQHESSQELSQERGPADSMLLGGENRGTIQANAVANTVFEDFMAAVLGGAWAGDVLTPGSALQSYTYEKTVPTSGGSAYHRFAGLTIGSWELNIVPGGQTTYAFGTVGGLFSNDSAEIVGATYADPSPALANTAIFLPHNVSRTFSGSLAGIDGVCLSELQLMFESANQGVQCIGTFGQPNSVLGPLTVRGTCRVLFQNDTVYDAFLAQTDAGLNVVLDDLVPSTNNHTLTIDIPRIKVQSPSLNATRSGEILIQDFEFEAIRPDPLVTITRATS